MWRVCISCLMVIYTPILGCVLKVGNRDYGQGSHGTGKLKVGVTQWRAPRKDKTLRCARPSQKENRGKLA